MEIKIKRSSKKQNSDHKIKIKYDYGSWDQSFYSLRIKKLRYTDHWIKNKRRSKSWDQIFSRIKTIGSICFMILGCLIKIIIDYLILHPGIIKKNGLMVLILEILILVFFLSNYQHSVIFWSANFKNFDLIIYILVIGYANFYPNIQDKILITINCVKSTDFFCIKPP